MSATSYGASSRQSMTARMIRTVTVLVAAKVNERFGNAWCPTDGDTALPTPVLVVSVSSRRTPINPLLSLFIYLILYHFIH